MAQANASMKSKLLIRSIFVLLASTFLNIALKAQELKVFDPISSASFRGLDVLNDSVWWVSGQRNTVMKTTDSGKSWTTMLVGDTSKRTDFRDIQVIDANTVLVMGITLPAVIYKTKDSGRSWKMVFHDTAASAFLDAFDFWDSKNGICLADPIDSVWSLLETKDGGDSWKMMSSKYRPDAQTNEAAFAAGGTPIRTFGKNEVAFVTGGAENSRILISKNKGKSWSYIFPLINSNKSSGIFSFDRNEKSDWVLVGGNYSQPKDSSSNLAIISKEKGMNTVSIFNENVPGGYRCSVERVTGSTLIATGDEGTDISYDNGFTWRALSTEGFFAVDCINGTCVFSGKKGKIGLIKISSGQ